MERMTDRDCSGELWYFGGTEADHLHRLAAYEDTGLTPEEIKEDMPHVRCKDCIHLGFKDFDGICVGGPVCGVVKPWDYCSHGVREVIRDKNKEGKADG